MAMAYFADPKSFGQIWKDKQSLVMIFVFALFGLFLNQFAYLEAIHETNAGTATVLQYLCPVGILAYTCIKDKVSNWRDFLDCHSWSAQSAFYDSKRLTYWSIFGLYLFALHSFAH